MKSVAQRNGDIVSHIRFTIGRQIERTVVVTLWHRDASEITEIRLYRRSDGQEGKLFIDKLSLSVICHWKIKDPVIVNVQLAIISDINN